MSIIVFQHSALALPGRLGLTLRDHGFRLDVRRPDLAGPHAVPTDLDGVLGVVSLGGPQNVSEQARHPWMKAEMDYLRRAHEAALPVIGICLGHQLLAAALGGTVSAMPRPELGFHTVSLNTTGQIEPVFAGIAWDCPQFQMHGEEVSSPPPGAAVLASSAACAVQAFRAGIRTFGFQYHFECGREMIRSFAASDADWLAQAGLSPGDVEQQAERYGEMFSRLADRLCVNLALLAFPLQRKMSA